LKNIATPVSQSVSNKNAIQWATWCGQKPSGTYSNIAKNNVQINIECQKQSAYPDCI